MCTHCVKTGHTIDICYRKHGLPLHYKFRNGPSIHNVFQEENVDVKNNEEDTVSRGEVSQQPTLLQQAHLHNQALVTQNQVSASQISTIPQPICS